MPVIRIPIENRQQWLGLRMNDVTASDVPAVCGDGLFYSAAKVFAEKRGLLALQERTAAMKRGIWGEPAVFAALADENPDWEIRQAKVYLRDVDARLGATPDGVAIVPGREGIVVVQAKTVAGNYFKKNWLFNSNDGIAEGPAAPPLAYQLQTLTETMLADATCGVIAALVLDWEWHLRLFWVERNAEAEDRIRRMVKGFWDNYLDTGLMPPVDGNLDEDLVKKLYPNDNGATIDLSGDNEMPEYVDNLITARADKSDAEKREKYNKTMIAGKLGDATFATIADGRLISNKTVNRKGFTVEPTSFRMLKVS